LLVTSFSLPLPKCLFSLFLCTAWHNCTQKEPLEKKAEYQKSSFPSKRNLFSRKPGQFQLPVSKACLCEGYRAELSAFEFLVYFSHATLFFYQGKLPRGLQGLQLCWESPVETPVRSIQPAIMPHSLLCTQVKLNQSGISQRLSKTFAQAKRLCLDHFFSHQPAMPVRFLS
jgi:hypothetical protein